MAKNRQPFQPLNSILYISEINDTITLSPELIKIEIVGEKAFGLSCLPEAWRLPFCVISDTLLTQYKTCPTTQRAELLQNWINTIQSAAITSGIDKSDNIIIRSSGCTEGLGNRGKFSSNHGHFNNLEKTLDTCLSELIANNESTQEKIPLIIQKYITPISVTGHLSNERRFSKEPRDWLGDSEDTSQKAIPFQISLKNWRQEITPENYIDKALMCNLSARVSEVLKIPATWASHKKSRIHFEWIWDGKTIYMVQADQETENEGNDPTQKQQYMTSNVLSGFTPKCLKEINDEHARQYKKINNVFIYRKLDLPITKLYILDDQSIIKELASGNVNSKLRDDVATLVNNSLVIRMDIATDDQAKRQLLPRTEEVRELSSALEWLKENSKIKSSNSIQEDVIFIFHNFIPAISSAFAYALPNERKVQIEALWGLPEGLYYNSHDKYIVDTGMIELDKISVEACKVTPKRNYKHFFISPDENGHWTPKILKPPYDWKDSIEKEEWIKQIAIASRRIAAEEAKPISIMWFVDVPNTVCSEKVFPWHHEDYELMDTYQSHKYHKKTPFDKSHIIRTSADIDTLRRETEQPISTIRYIEIQPSEDKLLRDKDTLQHIGQLAKSINATIVLEGGVLSHAYYQLLRTGATVEAVHPFNHSEDKHEFNKLVRDKIPSNIEKKGEIVNKAKLSGEFFLKALKDKLVEEAFEVLDAKNQEEIISELADVKEVIDGILSQLKVSKKELEQKQKQKREKVGGFKDGVVLVRTQNPLPSAKDIATTSDLLQENQENLINAQVIIEQSKKIEKQSDKRELSTTAETIMKLDIPAVLDNWTANMTDKITNANSDSDIKIQLIGTRYNSKYQIKISIYTPKKQLTLF